MNKVTISTRAEAPKIPSLDLRPYPTDDDSRINETISSNKLRRDMVDRNRKKFQIFKFQEWLYCISELMQLFIKNRIDILGIVDHKIIHDDPIEYHEKQNITFGTTSAITNANNAPIGGLGLLINRSSSVALAEIRP